MRDPVSMNHRLYNRHDAITIVVAVAAAAAAVAATVSLIVVIARLEGHHRVLWRVVVC